MSLGNLGIRLFTSRVTSAIGTRGAHSDRANMRPSRTEGVARWLTVSFQSRTRRQNSALLSWR
jgi:hypothetical protein